MTIPNAVGSHGSAFIDLTTAGAGVQHNTAAFVQGGIGAGTGNFDPFLTMSGGQNDSDSNPGTEKGYNTTSASGEFETFFGGGRTHPIRASAIPAVTVDPPGPAPLGVYREFSLDANDQGADDFMSIDALKVFLDNQNNLTNYNDAGNSFGTDDASAASLIYNMDAGGNTTVLMRSQGLTPGSGVSDITVLLPDSAFPAGCFYGAPISSCDKWLYFYTESGFAGTSPPDSNNYDVTAGFEEWQTRLIPVVAVSKTANTSFDRKFDWTVQKLVSTDDTCTTGFIDANTAATGLNINLFNGQSDTVCWKIISDRGLPVDSNIQLTGTITIVNPTGPGQPIEEKIDATINSVSDIVSPGGAATVVCPVTFPFTLAAGATLTCSYSKALSSSDLGTNTASAVVENGTTDLTYSSAAVPFDPSSGTINVEDENASLDDSRSLPGAPIALSGDDTRTYTEVLSCPSSRTESNTATLTETDTSTVHTDPAVVNITCHTLSVSKDASPSFNRTFDWTVQKLVSTDDDCLTGFIDANDAASALAINLFNGQSDTVCWKIVSTRGAAQDSGFAVNGTITITNNAPIAATPVSVTDLITAGDIAATVDCDPAPGDQNTGLTVPAKVGATAGTLTCSYSAALPNNANRTNTATASLAGQNYTGQANIVFGATPVNESDESASLDDSRVPGLPGAPVALSGNDTRTYTESLACGSDRNETNTATLTEGDSGTPRTDPAVVTIDCHGLTVSKDANETFTRTFDWTVKKFVSTDETCAGGFVDDTLNVTLNVGQSDTVCWKIVSTRGAAQDSGFAVNGTITITNNAPIAATPVSVTDLITAGDIAATVDCDPVPGNQNTGLTVPAKVGATAGTLTCSYSASLPDTTTRTNTATASLAGQTYTGTADVIFGDPTTVVDASATLDDSRTLPGAPVGLSGDDTRTYTEVLPCGSSRTETNTATLTENTSGQIRTDPAAVNLTCVQPGQGCTPGFWKAHTSVWDQLIDPVVDAMPAGFEFTTSTSFNAYFGLTPAQSGFPDDFTMEDAVNAGGGGASKLARHGVSALLNEVSVNYPIPPSIDTAANDFIDLYNAIKNAYVTGVFEPLATQLASNNDLPHTACPTS